MNQNNLQKNGQDGANQSFRYPKSVVAGVLLLSVLSITLIFWQMQNHLTLDLPEFITSQSSQTDRISLLEQEEAQLREQDSDLDGLSDYQELKVYGSSPFIADSDSDGIPDAVEVSNQTDPNCPEGQNCFGQEVAEEGTTPEQDEQQAALEAIASNPDQIRQLLIQAGVDPAIVEQADDQSLQIIAQQSLTTLNDPTDDLQALLDTLTTENIRGFYQTLGLNEEDISEFSNDELLLIVQGLVQEQLTGTPFQPISE